MADRVYQQVGQVGHVWCQKLIILAVVFPQLGHICHVFPQDDQWPLIAHSVLLVMVHGKWKNWPHFLVSRIGPFLSKGGHVYCHIALVTYCQRRAKYIVTLVKYCHRRAMFTGYIDHLLEQSHSATSEATSCHPTAINTRNLWKFHNWMCIQWYIMMIEIWKWNVKVLKVANVVKVVKMVKKVKVV